MSIKIEFKYLGQLLENVLYVEDPSDASDVADAEKMNIVSAICTDSKMQELFYESIEAIYTLEA